MRKEKLKPSELLGVKSISNSISQTYIDNKIKSKQMQKLQIN